MSTLQYENVTQAEVDGLIYALSLSARVLRRGGVEKCWDITYPSPIGNVIAAAYHIGKQLVIHLIDRPAAVSPEFIDSQIKKHLGRA